ncbi:hypothetical protein K456DRAFT_635008 [Colletotrichum gloeosporioides 23]|nr:hypothetical protein K456DRAFT_635008 [Colletotrichum gloeosporioides 23]
MRRRRRSVTADGRRGGRRFSHRSYIAAVSHHFFGPYCFLGRGLGFLCDGLGGLVIPFGWKLCQSLVLVVYRWCVS